MRNAIETISNIAENHAQEYQGTHDNVRLLAKFVDMINKNLGQAERMLPIAEQHAGDIVGQSARHFARQHVRTALGWTRMMMRDTERRMNRAAR